MITFRNGVFRSNPKLKCTCKLSETFDGKRSRETVIKTGCPLHDPSTRTVMQPRR